MENVEIAAVLNEIADLLEIANENPFKVRAYRNAARRVGGQARSIAAMVEAGEDLTELPAIGKDIAGYIDELVRTGHVGRLDDLQNRIPASLTELMRIDAIGPKRARALHDRLGIASIDDLARAIDEGGLRRMKGFGPKTEERITRAIRLRATRPDRYLLSDADRLLRPLLEHMQQAPGVERIEPAGSYRRRAETVGDIDLLAICRRAEPVMRHFLAYPEVERVEATGGTRGTVILRSGLHVDLRILPQRSYGAAMHYFTGSKSHNIAVRRLGVARGLRISEYGIFRTAKTSARGRPAKERRTGGATEEEVFVAVGMAWVPPELREDRGEVEAAIAGTLPRLVTREEIRGDLQMHSTWTDGNDSIEAMATSCLELGYEYLAITDHSRSVTIAGGLEAGELEKQWKEIDRVQRRLPEIRILRGMEVDILRDGALDLPEEQLARLDLVVVSVHSLMRMPGPKMTDRVIRALRHPAVHILGHPTGRLIGRREPYEIDLDAVLGAAAELDVAVELNAQPDRLDLDDRWVRRARDLGVKIAINTDAHSTAELQFMGYGVDQARRGWLEADDVLNTLPLPRLMQWLERKRTQARSSRRGRPRPRRGRPERGTRDRRVS